MRVGYIYDKIYLKHDTGLRHPESSKRLSAIEKEMDNLIDDLILLKPISASTEILALVHPHSHIDMIKTTNFIDSDTIVSAKSYDVAKMAVGAGVVAIDAIKNNKIDRAFAAVRPPGHHCTKNKAMGFCLFNNIAITARYAQQQGFKKVFIADFDIHHGNGTEAIFYDDDSVFYFSSHQASCYPRTGPESSIGIKKGKGFTSNHLLMLESGDKEILDIYKNDFLKKVKEFNPDIILVSAGYDLHESDPLAISNVTTEGIRQIVKEILNSANVPSIFMLEGGYNLKALAKNVKVTIEEMMKN